MPVIPQGATAEEKRIIMYDALSAIDLSSVVEKRDNLTYLSWSNCVSLLKQIYPDATYRVIKNAQGLPYFVDENLGIFVFTEVTIDGQTTEGFLPVMDNKMKAQKLVPYTYQAWDSFKKTYVEKTVTAADSISINKAIWRSLVKTVAIATGLGLYLYQGDDLPTQSDDAKQQGGQTQQPSAPQKPYDRFAGIKAAIGQSQSVNDLMSLYLDHQQEIEANPQVKSLLTQRKQQLQLLQ